MITSHVLRLLACSVCFGLLRAETPPNDSAPGPAPMTPGPRDQATGVRTVPYSTKTPSSTSTTKQFTVYGADLEMRGAFCLLCEDTAGALGRVLKDSGQYGLPVIVVLKTPPDITPGGPPVTLNIAELTHGGFHLQINAELRTGFRTSDFTRELVKVLLAERILRNHKKLSTTGRKDVLPAWVMTGVAQALDYRSRSRPSALFSAVFKRGQVYSLDRILTADPTAMDALSRGIYETSTCALVLTLLEQPDGPVRFSRFLNALAVESKSDRDLLTQYFPNLGASKSALEKWWSLQMAAMAQPNALETLGAKETEEELEKALTLLIPVSRKQEERPTVAAAPPPVEAPAEEPEEKKSRGFFGFRKRASKEEPKAEEKQKEKPPEALKPQAMHTPAARDFQVALTTAGDAYLTLLSHVSSVSSMFLRGQHVGLFKKKPKTADAAAEPEPENEGKKTATSADASKSEKPAADAKPPRGKTEEPAASLSEKPRPARSIGARPDDLPKAPPPTQAPIKIEKGEKPAAETNANTESAPPSADEGKSGKPSRFNPLNWFRKDPKKEGELADPNSPASEPEGQEPAKAADAPPKTRPKPEEDSEKRVAKSEKPAPEAAAKVSASPALTKAGSIPLEDFALIAKRADRSEILGRSLVRLNALKLRAHPLYKPVIGGYIDAVENLRDGKTKGAANKLEELRRERQGIHEKAAAVENHLDWYEANHTGTRSHAFDDFLRVGEELEKDRLPRNDELSKYLDSVQAEFK
jgi:hypothetical protein